MHLTFSLETPVCSDISVKYVRKRYIYSQFLCTYQGVSWGPCDSQVLDYDPAYKCYGEFAELDLAIYFRLYFADDFVCDEVLYRGDVYGEVYRC